MPVHQPIDERQCKEPYPWIKTPPKLHWQGLSLQQYPYDCQCSPHMLAFWQLLFYYSKQKLNQHNLLYWRRSASLIMCFPKKISVFWEVAILLQDVLGQSWMRNSFPAALMLLSSHTAFYYLDASRCILKVDHCSSESEVHLTMF